MAENPLLDGEHIVKSFDDELNWLDNAIAEMGGLAEAQLAKRTITISKTEPVGGAVNSIARMASMVQSMIKNVLDAYVSRDWERAADVRLRDEDVDHSHTSLFRELLTYMMEDPRNITACTHLLFIAKNVERIGDHTTNISEHIHFMVRGGEPENARINDDLSSYTVVEPK